MRNVLMTAILTGALSGPALAQTNIETLARTCNGCHGLGGVSVGSSMPSIGGLPRAYLARVMKEWKYGQRAAVTMNRIVRGFSDDEIDALATWFAAQPWTPVPQQAPAELLALGKRAVWTTCTDCHGMTGGDPDRDAPPLDGQWSKYMELELEKYRSPDLAMPHRQMGKAVDEVKPEDASAAVHWFGAQKR
ncbi:MAG: c-type cytochrome [Alphaproteobacteria bacterium]|nr:c-type cytochrome [Alphaproteobacteria bacterium]